MFVERVKDPGRCSGRVGREDVIFSRTISEAMGEFVTKSGGGIGAREGLLWVGRNIGGGLAA